MKSKIRNKALSMVTAVVMVLSIVGLYSVPAYAAEKPNIRKVTYFNTGEEPSLQVEYEDPNDSDLDIVEVYLLGANELKEGDPKPKIGFIEIDGKYYGILGIISIDTTNKDRFYKDPSTGRWISKGETFYLAGEKKPDPGQDVLIAVEPMHKGEKIDGYITDPVKVTVPAEGESVVVESGGGDTPTPTNSIKDCIIEPTAGNPVYNGRVQKPELTVISGEKVLNEGLDYSVAYPENMVDAGTYQLTVTGQGEYTDSQTVELDIDKAENTLSVKAFPISKSVKVKTSKVKKKKYVIKLKEIMEVPDNGEGTIRYSKASGSKRLSVNSVTGKVTLKKGTPKGIYRVKVNVTAAGNANYQESTRQVWVTVRVRDK